MDLAGLVALLTVVFLVVTMAGIGMRLDRPGRPTADRLVPVGRLAVASLVVVPIAGVVIAAALPLPEAAAFAILALAVAPAGTIGPKLVDIAGGDLGLGVVVAFSLSAIATLTVAPTLLLATAIVGIDEGAAAIEPAPIIGRLLAFQLLPLILGMVLRTRRAALAERVVAPATTLSNVLLVAVVAIALVDGWTEVVALGPLPFLAGLLLLVVADVSGWVAGGPAVAARRTGLLITGQRSGALALLVALGLDWSGAVAAVVALAVVNLVGNTIVATVLTRPDRLRVPRVVPSR